MDYRSPFELKQQLLEETRCSKPPSQKSAARSKGVGNVGGGTGAAPCASYSVSHAPVCAGASGGVASSSNSTNPFTLSMSLPDDPTALVREVPGAENLKALSAALERAEAVQRYMESENLSLEESVTYIMENGSTAQKMSFFAHVRDSLVDLPQKRVSKVLSILLDSMWAQDPELQCRAPEDLLGLMGILNSTTAAELFDVTQTMLTVKTCDVRDAWGKLLLGLASCLNAEQLEKRMIPLAISKGDHAEPQDQRELSCRLLGGLCEFIAKDKVETLVLPRALALCQDTNVGVRESMCQQLGTIARALGVELAKVKVAPDLFELLNDEEKSVSRAAFSCLLDLVEFFGPEYRREKLYPIIKSYVSSLPTEVTNLLIVEYGRFLDKIKEDIDATEDVVLFASFFEKAALQPDEEARRHCAFNFPAVVASLPLSVFATHLSPCLNKLANDMDSGVRRSIAAGLHELVPLLDNTAAVFLEKPFLILLRDSDAAVRGCLFRHIGVIMDCFVDQLRGGLQRKAFFAAVADTVLKQAPNCKTNWRDVHHLIFLISRYLSLFDETTVADYFAPVVVESLRDGAAVLKADCAHVLVLILCHVSTPATRVQLFSRLNCEFGHSPSCYHRQSYLRFVCEACQAFSRRCIRERLMESCFELQRDAVASVRVTLARTLPALANGLRANTSGAVEEEFNKMLQRLLMDNDDDVREAAQQSKELMDKAEKDRRLHPRKFEEAELEDQRRERAEQAMLDLAKECDKAERRAKLRDMLKNERDKELIDISPNSSLPAGRKPPAGVGRDSAGPSASAMNFPCSPHQRRKAGKGTPTLGHALGAVGSSGGSVGLPRILQGKSNSSSIPSSLSSHTRKRL